MTGYQDGDNQAVQQAERKKTHDVRLKFGKDDGFHAELRRRVDEYFQRTGLQERDCPRMYLKTAVVMGGGALCYVLLVFAARTWWQALPLAVLLGLAMACIGFNVQHDGGHRAYSRRPWINKLASMTLDLIGGSSYIWHWQHAIFHHTYANITGHDSDIDLGALGRLTPHQKRYAFHRWQHFYIWPFYGLMAVSWQLFGDYHELVTGRVKNGHRFPRPKGWDLATLVAGKTLFLTLAFGIPLMNHRWWAVLFFYGVTSSVLGLVLSVVFQLAHCVEEAEFPLPREDTGRVEKAWAIHQVETTVDFARRSRLACWMLGGLNFQVEHHLFPRVCHIHYPALSKVVEATCREYGVRYLEHQTMFAGVVSHFRWLRRMGLPDAAG